MLVRFWGTRGSIPSPGEQTVRYGGNTPCVEVRPDDSSLIILDAGTGIRPLGERLIASPGSVSACIAITHPHWDHIQGFPFFRPLFAPGNALTIIGPETPATPLRKIFSDVMNKTYFPVKLDELRASITFRPIGEEAVGFGSTTIRSCYVNHPFLTLGYRIEAGGKSLVYVSDNEPFRTNGGDTESGVAPVTIGKYRSHTGDPDEHLIRFVEGADLLIHDATFTPDEYEQHIGWGHADYRFALHVAGRAGVRELILFHHHFIHSDEEIDRILDQCRAEASTKGYRFRCNAAAEGGMIEW